MSRVRTSCNVEGVIALVESSPSHRCNSCGELGLSTALAQDGSKQSIDRSRSILYRRLFTGLRCRRLYSHYAPTNSFILNQCVQSIIVKRKPNLHTPTSYKSLYIISIFATYSLKFACNNATNAPTLHKTKNPNCA